MSFFKNRRQAGKTDPICGFSPVGGGGYKERVYRKINVVNILCTHASK
jgi:hypothetical protein